MKKLKTEILTKDISEETKVPEQRREKKRLESLGDEREQRK